MKYLLDTDHISILQLRSGPEFARLVSRIAMHPATDLAFSLISLHEQVLGANTYISRARNSGETVRGYTRLGEILQSFAAAPVLPFDTSAATAFDNLRAQRIRVATMDLRIAAITLSRSLILLTRNISDFQRVPGLVIEDWTL